MHSFFFSLILRQGLSLSFTLYLFHSTSVSVACVGFALKLCCGLEPQLCLTGFLFLSGQHTLQPYTPTDTVSLCFQVGVTEIPSHSTSIVCSREGQKKGTRETVLKTPSNIKILWNHVYEHRYVCLYHSPEAVGMIHDRISSNKCSSNGNYFVCVCLCVHKRQLFTYAQPIPLAYVTRYRKICLDWQWPHYRSDKWWICLFSTVH